MKKPLSCAGCKMAIDILTTCEQCPKTYDPEYRECTKEHPGACGMLMIQHCWEKFFKKELGLSKQKDFQEHSQDCLLQTKKRYKASFPNKM